MLIRRLSIKALSCPLNGDQELLFDTVLRSIIYNKDGLIAINKPYGVPVSIDNDNSQLSLTSIAPQLCEHLDIENLIVIKPLPKNISGIVLLSTNEKSALKILKSLNINKINKEYGKYWGLCVGVPNQDNSQLSSKVYVKRLKYDNKNKYELVNPKQVSKNQIKRGEIETHSVVTKCLAKNANTWTSLHEYAISSLKHNMIQLISAQKLLCPVIGDHLYSQQVKQLNSFKTRALLLNTESLEHKPQVFPEATALALKPIFPNYFRQFSEVPAPKPNFDLPYMIHFRSLTLKNTWSPTNPKGSVQKTSDLPSDSSSETNQVDNSNDEYTFGDNFGDMVNLVCEPPPLFTRVQKALEL